MVLGVPSGDSDVDREPGSGCRATSAACWGRAAWWWLLLLLWVAGWIAPETLAAQDATVSSTSPIELFEVGIDGRCKVGAWTPVRWVLDATRLTTRVRVSLETADGEGVATRYDDDSWYEPGDARDLSGERLVRIGRLRTVLTLRLIDESGTVIESQRKPLDTSEHLFRSTDQWIVQIGPEIGLEEWLRSRQGRFDDRPTFLMRTEDSSVLPSDFVGWSGVDLVVIALGDGGALASAQPKQLESLVRWVEDGGTVVFTGARASNRIAQDGSPLLKLLPGLEPQLVQQTTSSGIEVFAAADEQLLGRGQSYPSLKLTEARGRVLAYETLNAESIPIAIDMPCGLGRVVWAGVDLDQAPFAAWRGRTRLVGRLLDHLRGTTVASTAVRGGRVMHLGYDDLSGQLRSALDRFSSVSLVTFTAVAAIVVLFIACIGPIDYFLLRRFTGRMELTWATSGLLVLLFTSGAIVLLQLTKGNQVLVTQLEMVDVNGLTGEVRGTVWAHLYSPSVRRFDLSLQPEKLDQGDAATGASNLVGSRRSLLSWQGLAGDALGGMDTELGITAGTSDYQILFAPEGTSRMQGVSVQVGGTRPLTARWWDRLSPPQPGRLYLDRRNNSLHGEVTNPLPVTLDQAIIFFDSWAYVVSGDLQPGETISVEGQTTERTLEGLLARRQVVKGAERSEPWDPRGVMLPRIAEMLSFHQAAGGRDYTSLHHRVLTDLDWTHHLRQGEAVLFARAKSSLSTLADGGQSLSDAYDQRVTIVRLLLPVDRPETIASPFSGNGP